tara:strand:- start:9563 stop:10555 length:993 start_codon:yes stop_codon:yes gene_type:complete
MSDFLLQRPRRLRRSEAIRSMVRETSISPDHLIAPLFVVDGKDQKIAIKSMPGQYRYSVDLLVKECLELYALGVHSVAIFPAIDTKLKTSDARESINPKGLYPSAIKAIKDAIPEMLVMTDVALDPYNSDGHDGLVDAKTGQILNDETLELLTQMSIMQAAAGADIIGPSDMMDGRVAAIRDGLDSEGYSDTAIMSYTAKYASAFYGPFRDALDSAPKAGDKKTYQMDPANSREAIKEAMLDESEGADFLMVKPGIAYLDIIQTLAQSTALPIAAYNVSGEYAMVKAAAQNGWIDGDKVMQEMLMSFRRAGADVILTYFAKEFAALYRAR